MKFTYRKQEQKLAVSGDVAEPVVHLFELEGGDLKIAATREGVKIYGTSQWFQPVNEEMKIPDDFREFMVRLSSAFEMSFNEQKSAERDSVARQAILGLR